MHQGWFQMDLCQFFVTDFLPERIEGCVQFCFDLQSRSGSCMTNQFYDDLTIEQRTTTPVLRDPAEQAMLDLVPLARPWWEMANAHRQPQPVRQLLQGHLPQAAANPIATTAIRR